VRSTVDQLVNRYSRRARLPWTGVVSPAERVWIVIYPPRDERRVRARLTLFELATKDAGHSWLEIDVTDSYARWLGGHEFAEAYFKEPALLPSAQQEFAQHVRHEVEEQLGAADDSTVVALVGVGSLFGVGSASQLIKEVQERVSGRLVVFFPGQREGNNYRLFDARDGWNYLALPIEAGDDDE
jgi:Domain of unknown function (DUF1788)